MRELVLYLLKNRLAIPLSDWTVQGFGFMRLRISPSMRLHVWDARLREARVSDIHDHAQWAFISHIISGQIVNIRYRECAPTCDNAQRFNMATLVCGIGGGMQQSKLPEVVTLCASKPEIYTPGMSYNQEPDEIHRTHAADGTVTLLEQRRRDTDTARVFWPLGVEWGDAIPRQATRDEVDFIGGFALAIMEAAS